MKTASLLGALLLCAACPASALAQSADDLKNDQQTPGDVLVYGMGYSGQRYSPLTRIDKSNIGQLVPKWAYSINDSRGAEAFPVVKDGVIYTTAHNMTAAVDALTGKQLWRTAHDYPPETLRVVCCGIVNRGVAIYNGMIIRLLLDNQIIAMDAKTGKVIWQVKSPEPATIQNGYAMTAAPLIANGVIIVGVAGAEFSIRGFLEGYDVATGKHLWRLYTVPAPARRVSETWGGDSALTGGGSSWVTGSYDPELDLVYWGIGNPAPWNPRARSGDNLFTNAIFAVRPKTGERVWYYQTTPEDPFDYDAVQTPVVATLNVAGAPTKVVMQANRSGFLYVLDAKDGKLIAANPFGKVNWADGIDKETGRPKVTSVFKEALEGKKVTVWPSVSGVTNWQHMSFSPKTGMLYINTLHLGMTYEAGDPPKLVPGRPSGSGTRQAHRGSRRSQRARLPEGRRPADRQVEVGDAVQEPELLLDHGDGERSRIHRRHDRRIPGARRRDRQDIVELPNSVGHHRPAHHVGEGRQAVRDRHERHRRGLCAALRRSQSGQRAGRRHHVDLRPVRQVTATDRGSLPPRRQRLPRLLSLPINRMARAETPTQTGRRVRTPWARRMKRHATLASLSLSGSGPRRFAAAAALAVLLFAAAGARACEFPIVKEQIDIVLDRDARLGAEFRAQVKDGSDSVAVIESLVSAEMREKVDVCRFYVAEYLTKRGFPPPH